MYRAYYSRHFRAGDVPTWCPEVAGVVWRIRVHRDHGILHGDHAFALDRRVAGDRWRVLRQSGADRRIADTLRGGELHGDYARRHHHRASPKRIFHELVWQATG